ncbi:hypothetical protein CC86DRAFT_406735 [Ophiobolus disseminans]|uniref:Uncharacterized protein n=1 Tax=Ophiobolus disseminans TaxID=1469910 RepID=A0A6A6ZZH6_9PLEO|nr:hypothetical protein CC86DRAFT_406735 [Ophiobolus disseminans]
MAKTSNPQLQQVFGKLSSFKGKIASLPHIENEIYCQPNDAATWVQMLADMQSDITDVWNNLEHMKHRKMAVCAPKPLEFNPAEEEFCDTFRQWCISHNADAYQSNTPYEFLRHQKLRKSRFDPLGYFGMTHAVHLITAGERTFQQLDFAEQGLFVFTLNKIYADYHIGHSFDAGQIIDDRWQVVSRLSDAYGFFNQGVHFVYDA